MNKLNLKAKLLVATLPIVIISMAIIGIVLFQSTSKLVFSNQDIFLSGYVDQLGADMDNWLQENLREAELFSQNPLAVDVFKGRNLNDFQSLLKNYIDKSPTLENIFIAKTSGEVVMSATGEKQFNLSAVPAYKTNIDKATRGQMHIGSVNASSKSGRPVILVTAPVKENGQGIGFVGMLVELNSFSDLKVKNVSLGNGGYVYIFDNKGIMLAHPKESNILSLDISKYDFGKEALNKRNGVIEYLWEGSQRITYIKELESKPWIVAVGSNLDELYKPVRQQGRLTLYVVIGSIIVFIVVMLFMTNVIVKSVKDIANRMYDISEGEGDLTQRLTAATQDEIGTVAERFNVFIEKIHSIIKDISGNTDSVSASATELSSIAEHVNATADQNVSKSATVSAAAEEMSSNMNNVASATEQSTTKVNEVAAGIEEMNASINEIAQNAAESSEISKEAVEQAKTASVKVNELGHSAREIGKVTETIAAISNQTNLLALNATIEAARAGEAGKGFAVVANEIKELAKQTADATEDISQKLKGVQDSSETTVVVIEKISEVINRVNDMVASIAAAVEQQNSTSRETAHNIAEISDGLKEVSENIQQASRAASQVAEEISGVNESANEMSNASAQVKQSGDELSNIAEKLNVIVKQFKI